MKEFKKLWLGVLVLLLCNACSSDDSAPIVKDEINYSISLTLSVGSGMDQGFESGDRVGIYLYDNNLYSLTSGNEAWVSNLYLTYASSQQWTSAQTIYWQDAASEKLSCIAYYPVQYHSASDNLTSIAYTQETNQSTLSNLRNSDLFWGKKSNIATLSETGYSNISVKMSRLLSKVRVVFSGFSGEITNCCLHGAVPYGTLNLSTGSLKVKQGISQTVQMYYNSDTGVAEALLIPQTLPSGDFITFTNEGKDYTYQLTSSLTVEKGSVSTQNISADYFNKYQTGDAITYLHSRDQKPVTLVVTGDGFTTEDMSVNGNFETAARKALDQLFVVEPFRTYRDYFNVYIIPAVSKQSGSSTSTLRKDTYFGVGWTDSSYSDMDVSSAESLYSFVKTYCPDVQKGLITIDEVSTFILCNDNRYGGITSITASGRSYSIIPIYEGQLAWLGHTNEKTIGDWTNVFVHECGGHSFGRLLDEYSYDEYQNYPYSYVPYHNWTLPYGYNITTDNNNAKGTCYWKHLLSNSNYSEVGFYQGGAVYCKGVWRSEETSCMDANQLYFNAISRQLIVERIMTLAGLTFSLSDFYQKDVKTTASNLSTKQTRNVSDTNIQLYPKLPSPKLK